MESQRSKFRDKMLLYVTEHDISRENGPGINEREFLFSLSERDDIAIVALIPKMESPRSFMFIDECYVSPFSANRPIHAILYQLWLIYWMYHSIRKKQPDAIVVRPYLINLAPLIVSIVCRIPILIKTLAGYSSYMEESKNLIERFVSKVTFPIFQQLLRRAMVIDTQSPCYLQWQSQYFGIDKRKMIVIRNGANSKIFRPMENKQIRNSLGISNDMRVIGYAGAVRRLRNLDWIAKSLKLAESQREINNIRIVLIGDGEFLYDLKKLIGRLEIDHYFLIPGRVPYSVIPEWLNLFDFGIDLTWVGLSRDSGIERCSFSQKISQYLLCGTPVIACNLKDNRFIEENQIGFLVDPGDYKELADLILEISVLPDSYIHKIRKVSARYSAENLSNDVLMTKRINAWAETLNW